MCLRTVVITLDTDKTGVDRDKQFIFAWVFAVLQNPREVSFSLAWRWYRPCQNWLEAGGQAGQLRHDTAWHWPDSSLLQGLLSPIWPPASSSIFVLLSPSSSPHLSYLAHFRFYQKGIKLCMTCLFVQKKSVRPPYSQLFSISRSPPCRLMLTTLAFTVHSPPSLNPHLLDLSGLVSAGYTKKYLNKKNTKCDLKFW